MLKVKISSPEIKLIFTPVTYCHLVNIGRCFKSKKGSNIKSSSRLSSILQNAQNVQFVKKKGRTFQYWYEQVAVFSGEYVYFYSMENANLLTKAKNKLDQKSLSVEEENDLNQLEYVDYFFVKGC